MLIVYVCLLLHDCNMSPAFASSGVAHRWMIFKQSKVMGVGTRVTDCGNSDLTPVKWRIRSMRRAYSVSALRHLKREGSFLV